MKIIFTIILLLAIAGCACPPNSFITTGNRPPHNEGAGAGI